MTRRSYYFLLSFCALFALGFTRARATYHRHPVSISHEGRQPATDCADLRIRFDDRDAVVRSEEHSLTRAEAGNLHVQPHANGGLQVVGWDKDTYSVTACKAAAGPADEAERVLSQITLSVQPGRVTTNGPGSEEDWTVYLLIRAPKAANLEMETMNGPLALYDVDGKVTAKTHNGPIHLKNFSGEAEITAVNGPISLEGGKGSVKIHTENGPISVELAGSSWTGEGLSADAHNGPVTLSVPSGFQSSFMIESTNYAPVSCKASVCESARKTWDDEHRRIEYGNGPATIRLSTVNGPVSVRDSHGSM